MSRFGCLPGCSPAACLLDTDVDTTRQIVVTSCSLLVNQHGLNAHLSGPEPVALCCAVVHFCADDLLHIADFRLLRVCVLCLLLALTSTRTNCTNRAAPCCTLLHFSACRLVTEAGNRALVTAPGMPPRAFQRLGVQLGRTTACAACGMANPVNRPVNHRSVNHAGLLQQLFHHRCYSGPPCA